MADKIIPAPRTAGDAAQFMRMQARQYADIVVSEGANGASGKRLGLSQRIGHFYAEAAAALESLPTPPAEPFDMEDLLS